jgi:hypothetical protein
VLALETTTADRPAAEPTRRRRFTRTLARARWREYEELLAHALAAGYDVISLERFVERTPDHGRPLLVLRHDSDQHPRSALRMAAIERAAGLTSTWYFRWRTAEPRVIRRLRSDGFEVGLHYETLTRRLLETGRPADTVDEALIESCRQELSTEVDAFVKRFGPIVSICPHGDTRVPGVHNGVLMRDQPPGFAGGVIDCNEAMRGRDLAAWMTDRSTPDGGWASGIDPIALLDRGATPLLCLTHPNNWTGGSGLLLDRIASAVLPRSSPAPIRTLTDRPPI